MRIAPWTVLFTGALAAACGSRTALPIDPDSCLEAGASRSCENACGVGTQVCVGDHYEPCRIPISSRPCTNACGHGSQTCTDGTWNACDVAPVVTACSTRCGPGQEKCIDGVATPCDAPQPGPPTWTATVRDFTDAHPDFEAMDGGAGGYEPGIVEPMLGPDNLPVYAGSPTTPSTHGAAFFDEWYRDVPSVNETTTIALPLQPAPGDPSSYGYSNHAFFPIDNQLLGNQGRSHNFDFTLEVATELRYSGGEVFEFACDDDCWVFVNRHLAADDGGVHAARTVTVDLDSTSAELGIAKGGTYAFHLFFAERHVLNSALDIRVDASDFAVCP